MADTDNAPDFSIFDLPTDQDPLTMFGEAPAPAAPPPAAAPETPPVAEVVEEKPAVAPEPKVETPQEPAAPKTVELGDDDLITITQDGKLVPVKWGEYKGNVMRQADYTRKTTKVAEREKELETVATTLQSREEALLTLFQDKAKFAELFQRIHGQPPSTDPAVVPPAAVVPDDDELVTNKDLKSATEQAISSVDARVAKVIEAREAARFQAEQEQFAKDLRTTTESTLDAVMKDHQDALGDIPHVDVVIKRMAWQDHQPTTLDEVKAAIIAAGKALSEQLAGSRREQKKQEAVKKTALETGIEPQSGGAPPAREKKEYNSWDDVDTDVVSWITQNQKG